MSQSQGDANANIRSLDQGAAQLRTDAIVLYKLAQEVTAVVTTSRSAVLEALKGCLAERSSPAKQKALDAARSAGLTVSG